MRVWRKQIVIGQEYLVGAAPIPLWLPTTGQKAFGRIHFARTWNRCKSPGKKPVVPDCSWDLAPSVMIQSIAGQKYFDSNCSTYRRAPVGSSR